MTTAWVIMAAMPPTKGHANLIRFAASLSGISRLNVIVHAKDSEPWAKERYEAVSSFVNKVPSYVPKHTYWLSEESEENPEAPGFWEYWDHTMLTYGFRPGDIWVTSEPYGATLAARMSGVFMPYDPQRELLGIKATAIREDPLGHFDEILPEFQKYIRQTVTVFGAESTGKTTLSKGLALAMPGHWLFEWARPYLELVGKEITVKAMVDIWKGQTATQRHAQMFTDKPFIIQDTDLFSTIGYWEQPHWKEALGPVPEGLIKDAFALKSDLYIITKSNIPFEPDDIRYGIDKRESPDDYWIGLADKYNLNYVVLDSDDRQERYREGVDILEDLFYNSHKLTYDRQGY